MFVATNGVIVEGSATSMRECRSKSNAIRSFRGSGTCGARRRGCIDERDRYFLFTWEF